MPRPPATSASCCREPARGEPFAAAAAGKDELKQAAKRVLESKRKPLSESPAASQQQSAGSEEDTVESLRRRVAALTAENMALHQQVAFLREQLLARAGNAEQTADLSAPF